MPVQNLLGVFDWAAASINAYFLDLIVVVFSIKDQTNVKYTLYNTKQPK